MSEIPKRPFTDLAADRLPGVVAIWLWEFEDPANWPSNADVEAALAEIESRPDADHVSVRVAAQKCRDYIKHD